MPKEYPTLESEKNIDKESAMDGVLELYEMAGFATHQETEKEMLGKWRPRTILERASSLLAPAIVQNISEDAVNSIFETFIKIGKDLGLEKEANKMALDRLKSSFIISKHLDDVQKWKELGLTTSDAELAEIERELVGAA